MGGGAVKKKEEPKVEAAPVIVKRQLGRRPMPEKPKSKPKKKAEPPKIIPSPLEVTDVRSCKSFK